MWIVFAILKWIGILLGGIIGVLLFLGAFVLFVPVRYRVEGSNRGKITYCFRFSWLLSLAVIVKKRDSDKIILKILGIPVKCLAGGKQKDKKAESSIDKRETPHCDTEKKQKETFRGEKIIKEDVCRKKDFGKKKRHKSVKQKKNPFSFTGVSGIIGLVKDTENRRVICRMLKEIQRMIRYLSPTRICGTAILGTGDPCTTGLLIGGISLFPFIYQDNVHIAPDFEEKRFEAEGYMRGRLRVIYFLRLILRIYQDRECKRLWKQINQVKKEAV